MFVLVLLCVIFFKHGFVYCNVEQFLENLLLKSQLDSESFKTSKCLWILIQGNTHILHKSKDFFQNLNFALIQHSPRIILNNDFKFELNTSKEMFHFSHHCSLVTFVSGLDENSEFDAFGNDTRWHNLVQYNSVMFTTYFLFFKINSEQSGIQRNISAFQKFPFWHPFKTFVQLGSNTREFIVTSFCWHCEENGGMKDASRPETTWKFISRRFNAKKQNLDQYTMENIFPDFTTNLNQKSLLIHSMSDSTCQEVKIHLKKLAPEKSISFYWYTIDALAGKLNFTCQIKSKIAPEIAGQVDFYTSFPLMHQFYSKVENSPSLAFERISFCYYIHKTFAHSWQNIFYPFERTIWSLLIASWILVAIIFWITFGSRISLWKWIWITYKTLLAQDLGRNVKNLIITSNPNQRFRIILTLGLAVWILFSTLNAAAYSSKLSSLLTMPRAIKKFPETFEDLVELKWDVGTPHHLMIDSLVEGGTPAFVAVWNNLKNFSNEQQCMKYASEHEQFACVGFVQTIVAHTFINSTTTFNQIKKGRDNTFLETGVGLAWRWWFPYRKRFTKTVTDLTSAGLPALWLQRTSSNTRRKKLNGNPKTPEKEKEGYGQKPMSTKVVMTLDHLKGSFYLFDLGIILSLLIFVIENLRFRIPKKAIRFRTHKLNSCHKCQNYFG